MDEAHVEHLVGLVEDEDLDLVEAQRALVEMIDETAGRRYEDVDAAHQAVDLGADRDAAENHRDGIAEMLAVGAKALCNLAGQLAGG